MMKATIAFLRAQEWTMGNGQCDWCCGNSRGWAPHPCVPTKDYEGHEKWCPLATALVELGQKVLFAKKDEEWKEEQNKKGWKKIFDPKVKFPKGSIGQMYRDAIDKTITQIISEDAK